MYYFIATMSKCISPCNNSSPADGTKARIINNLIRSKLEPPPDAIYMYIIKFFGEVKSQQ